MGWLPSFLGGGKSNDPFSSLDPSLRSFLEKESPVKYNKQASQESATPSSTAPSPPSESFATTAAPQTQAVPSESLYKDGRYAHLWKGYRPQAEIEEANATEHDKMMNVLEAFNSRKAAIGRAALENCAIQQEEWVNCMKSGSWEGRLKMCSDQVRKYERCYTMQHRFLRALGYASVNGRSAAVEEDIQMHADSLYQRMLQHEVAVEQAKKDGTAIPVFELKVPQVKGAKIRPDTEIEKQWQEKLEKLLQDERAAEEAALRADLEVNTEVARNLGQLREAQRAEREARRDRGETTWTDSFAGMLSGGKGK